MTVAIEIPSRKTPSLWYVLIAVLTIAAFARATHFQYVELDDQGLILENPLLQHPTINSLILFWTKPQTGLYVPMMYSTWWILASVGLTGAAAHHAASILFHAIACCMVLSILRRCVRNDVSTFLGAAIYAIHPLQIESVAWISELDNVIAGAFGFAALRVYLAAAEPECQDRLTNYLIATGLFLLTLLSKPTGAAIPLMAAALDVYILKSPIKQIARRVVPWLVLVIPITLIAQGSQPVYQSPLWSRPVIALDTIGFYLQKLYYPFDLTMDYGRTPLEVWAHALWIVTGASAILIGVVTWFLRSSYPLLWPGYLIFILGIAPNLGLVAFSFQGHSTTADRYVYLGMLGIALAATQIADWRILALIAALLLIRTEFQLPVWHDTQTLADHTLEIDPDAMLANKIKAIDYLVRKNDPVKAIPYFQRALIRLPDGGTLHLNLGSAYDTIGDHAKAETELKTAIADLQHPEDYYNLLTAMTNLGQVYFEEKQFDLARKQFEGVLKLDPKNESAQAGLDELAVPSP